MLFYMDSNFARARLPIKFVDVLFFLEHYDVESSNYSSKACESHALLHLAYVFISYLLLGLA